MKSQQLYVYQCLIQIQLMPKGGWPFFTISQENPCLFLYISVAQSTPDNKERNSIIFEQLYRGVPTFPFLLLRDIEKGFHYMKRKYCFYFLLQSWGLNVDVHLVSWLIQRKRGYPISLERCQPQPFRHVSYLSTQTLSLEKHAQLPLTSVAMTPSSGKKVVLCTTLYFLFSLLYNRTGDWLFALIFPMFAECTLPGVHINAKKKKTKKKI